MLGAVQERLGLGLEVLHGDAGKGLQHPGGQHRQLAVVAVVVLGRSWRQASGTPPQDP